MLAAGGDPPVAPEVTVYELPPCDQYTVQGDAFSRRAVRAGPAPTPPEDAVGNMRVIEQILAAGSRVLGAMRTPRYLRTISHSSLEPVVKTGRRPASRANAACRRADLNPSRRRQRATAAQDQVDDELVEVVVAVALLRQDLGVERLGGEGAGVGRVRADVGSASAVAPHSARASWIWGSSAKRRALAARARYVRMHPAAKSHAPSVSSTLYGSERRSGGVRRIRSPRAA